MSYFNLLSMAITGIFTRGITEIAELFTSIKRLQDFLIMDEYDYKQIENIITKEEIDSKAILTVKDLTVKWNANLSEAVLRDITMDVNRGKLIGVIGPVGCGKSSLLQTFLGK